MNKIVLIGAICAAALAGCTPVAGPDAGAANVAFKNEAGKSFVAGFTPVDVSIKKDGKIVKEGASCQIDSSKYAVKFTAPGKVNLPGYSKGAVPVKMVCTIDGQSYATTHQPVNLSRRARNQSSAAVGILLCPICGIGMAIGNSANKNQQEGDIFGFVKLEVDV